jgi:dTDP-4-dehydrorhamnose 3,5-epimerase
MELSSEVAASAAAIRRAVHFLSDQDLVAFVERISHSSSSQCGGEKSGVDAQRGTGSNPYRNVLALAPLPVHGGFRANCARWHDSRGFFQEIFNDGKYVKGMGPWRQTSWSRSRRGVLRGLHTSQYGKLVTCVRGAVYDVFVDVREGSPTFLRWTGVLLTESNRAQVYVPAGCAHGFLALDESNDVVYLQEGVWNPPEERDLLWSDPLLGVPWKDICSHFLPSTVLDWPSKLVLSDKDRSCPTLVQRIGDQRVDAAARAGSRPRGTSSSAAAFGAQGRALIVGGSGQIGSAMLEEFAMHGWQTLGTFCSLPAQGSGEGDTDPASFLARAPPGMTHFDLADVADVASGGSDESGLFDAAADAACDALLATFAPTAVIICAGWTWVDGCERDEARAFALNAEAPARLARAARRAGARTVYLSTEYVFSGGAGGMASGPYAESDAPAPINAYGRSKLEGERLVAAADPDALILRTTVVFGPARRLRILFLSCISTAWVVRRSVLGFVFQRPGHILGTTAGDYARGSRQAHHLTTTSF